MCFAVVLANSTLGDWATVYLWSADPQDHIWPRGTAVARKTSRGYVQTNIYFVQRLVLVLCP